MVRSSRVFFIKQLLLEANNCLPRSSSLRGQQCLALNAGLLHLECKAKEEEIKLRNSFKRSSM